MANSWNIMNVSHWCTKTVNTRYGVSIWKSIRALWDVFAGNTELPPGNGRKIAFWNDKWIGQEPLKFEGWGNKVFTIKGAYAFFSNEGHHSSRPWKQIWKAKAPSRDQARRNVKQKKWWKAIHLCFRWTIWTERNSRCFEKNSNPMQKVFMNCS
ncbi:hypothetical protein H5410_000729 [Solanum commersonii]|uniref:Uncharacterized protein n=1 Tax=Solanum commersonii TaxID=4109 RepID=A0A9J6AX22_SOLCO|nr:hypothetical protein H5410_000729 [Solanum commersonii]